jgi:spermidine synthase
MKKPIFLLVNIITSLTSLFYFLLITREASILTGEETLFQSLSLGFYLLFMGLGSSFIKKEETKTKILLKVLKLDFSVLLVGTLSPIILYLILSAYMALNFGAPISPQDVPVALTMTICLGSASLLGFFTGGQLPLFISYINKHLNIILFMNYLGALLAGPFLNKLLEYESSSKSLVLSILFVNFFTPISIFILTYAKRSLVVIATIPLLFCFIFYSYDNIEKNFLTAYYHGVKSKSFIETYSLHKSLKVLGDIKRINSPYQRIDIVRENPISSKTSNFPGNLTIYLNHKPQFDLLSYKTYHESMLHGALNLSGKRPHEILILGGGDGLLLNELTKSGYQNITLIELDQQMINLSSNHYALSYLNENVLSRYKDFSLDTKVKIITDDGFHYIRSHLKKYDAIFIDFPYPYSDEIINLYSKEFYTIVNSRLKENGFIVLDFPITDVNSKRASLLAHKLRKTLREADITNSFSFGPYSSFVYAQKNKKKIFFNYQKLPKGLSLSTHLNLVSLEHLFKNIEDYKPFSLFYGE